MNFYNEFDPFCVDWLNNLISAGCIPEGKVDDRSIEDVKAADIVGYGQVHFFAGVAGWCEALRLAGWESGREVWTMSCPCQPYSSAGKQKAESDERHLWPEARRLIAECRPATLFGEQVESKLGREWFSRVRFEMEELGYAVGASDLCAACVSAPHRRQRLYFGAIRLADTQYNAGRSEHVREQGGRIEAENNAAEREGTCGLADSDEYGRPSRWAGKGCTRSNESKCRCEPGGLADTANGDGRCGKCRTKTGTGEDKQRRFGSGICGEANRMGDSVSEGLERHSGHGTACNESGRNRSNQTGSVAASSAWSDSYAIECLDGKSRRLGTSDEPLAAGIPRDLGFLEPDVRKLAAGARRNRKGRLKGYGNSIVPQVGALFIRSFMESIAAIV